MKNNTDKKPKVIIIGGGFGGLTVARHLKDADVEILLIDKTNHHLFQPLLYQVATAALSPGDIAIPIRSVLNNQPNTTVIMGEVTSVNKEKKEISVDDEIYSYDYLIIATGACHSYFGKNHWEEFAPGLKTLTDALKIRERIFYSFEQAEKIGDKEAAKKFLTFVIVGGGPTGVEVAGAIAEIARKTMLKDFRRIELDKTRIILIEATDKILSSYPESLCSKAKKELESMGVEVMLNNMVTEINSEGVQIGKQFIETVNVIWAAGNTASSLLQSLNCKLDRSGRVVVESDCSIKNNPDIFVIGDTASFKNENEEYLPGIAPVAIQQGKYVAEIIHNEITLENRKPFIYNDKGMMATIGRAKAVAVIRNLKFSGLIAWLLWCFLHVLFLIGFRNRFRVMAEWIWHYFTMNRGIRLITGKPRIF